MHRNQRLETDLLGTRAVPADALWGIHTAARVENFPLAGRPVRRNLVHAFGAVKLACARTNHELGRWDEPNFAAIESACEEMIDGRSTRTSSSTPCRAARAPPPT